MGEWEAMCRERARELARDPRLTVRQISERTGVCVEVCRRYVREERKGKG